MSVIDEVLKANENYASRFEFADIPIAPARKLAVVACMDARFKAYDALGLKPGDAHVIRNAGGIVTGDTLRSLIISHHLLGTREIMIVNHTDCGMLTFKDEELRERLRKWSGTSAAGPAVFHAFSDVEDNVREQIQKVRSHPWLPRDMPVRGFVYDVKTGRLSEVSAAETRRQGATGRKKG